MRLNQYRGGSIQLTSLLIDGDILAYRASLKGQSDLIFGNKKVAASDPKRAVAYAEEWVSHLSKKFETDKIVFGLSDDVNFRHSVYPQYKAFRKDLVRPILLEDMKAWIRETQKVFQKPGLEGDDVCGILATHPTIIKGRKIIVSIDKDMKQIPGALYLPHKDQLLTITEEEGDRFHMWQTLAGDRVDGYPGLHGIGKVKATKLLAEDPSWATVVAAYEAKGKTEEDALIQARVARICRASDYDFKKKEVRLWHPTN